MQWEQVVATNLRRLRKERGLTQERLALDAEVAVRHIRDIERAETSATIGMLGKLAVVLGVHPSEFLVDVGGQL